MPQPEAMPEFRTTKCSQHGHRELTVKLTSPVPNLHTMLTDYVESAVAKGTKFLPGQTLQLGWSTLKFIERPDGTLGVQERELTPEEQWTESAQRALVDLWTQREIASSLGLADELEFPKQTDDMLIYRCVTDETEGFVLNRMPKEEDLPPGFSGWSLSCTQRHEHGEVDVVPLLAIAANQPGLVQLLALPHGCTALVTWEAKPDAPAGRKRIVPRIFRDGEELKPADGTYLAALQA